MRGRPGTRRAPMPSVPLTTKSARPRLAAGTRSPPPQKNKKTPKEVTGKSCTFSLGSPPPPPLQLAFDLAALVSPRRAAAVPKHGCHQRSVLWSGAQGKNLEPGAAESVSPSLSVCLVAQRPRAFDVASDYIFVSPSSLPPLLRLSSPLFFFLIHLGSRRGARLAVPVSPLKLRLTLRLLAAQRGSSL